MARFNLHVAAYDHNGNFVPLDRGFSSKWLAVSLARWFWRAHARELPWSIYHVYVEENDPGCGHPVVFWYDGGYIPGGGSCLAPPVGRPPPPR